MTPPSPARRAAEHVLIVAVAVAGPLAYLFASPLYSSGDEAAHVDYALQLWTGRLPVFEDGLVLSADVGTFPPVQWTAQHPPLLYLLLAPVVGPLASSGDAVAAGYAARIVIVALSVALAYAVRGLATALRPGDRRLGLLAVAVLALSQWFLRLGGSVYNDVLAALVVVLATTAFVRMVRGARTWTTVAGFVVALALASLVRLASVPPAGLLAAALLVLALVDRRPGRVRLVVAGAAGPLAMLAASGWFYARNLALTGSISGGHPEWAMANLGRERTTLAEVVAAPDTWRQLLGQFSPADGAWSLAADAVLFLAPVAIGAVVLAVGGPRAVRAPRAFAVAVILAAGVGVLVMQLLYVGETGSPNGRYLFTVTATLAPLLAAGLLAPPRGRWLAAAWIVVEVVLVAALLHAALSRTFSTPQAGIQPVAAWIAFAVLSAGALAIAGSTARSRRAVGA
ncbi:hypothetical protein [Microbacterium gilvum]|uniref:hypothetical protein n=1 Tax=Microbacterium gilvum TaxID=1336204 RepID=UPI0031EC4E00